MENRDYFGLFQSLEESDLVRWLPEIGDSASDSQLLNEALEQPMDCEPLSSCVFAGDRVAIAVQPEFPAKKAVVKALVQKLLACGLQPNEILIVQDHSSESISSVALENDWDIHERFHSKDTSDSVDGSAMIGVSQDGNPIYINRHLADADVVIPLVSLESDSSERLQPGFLYPAFSTQDTIDRLAQDPAAARSERRQAESFINPFFVVTAGKEAESGKLKLLLGSRSAVEDIVETGFEDMWETAGQQDCGLVLACLQDVGRSESFRFAKRAILNSIRISEQSCPVMLISNKPLGVDTSKWEELSDEEKQRWIDQKNELMELVEQVTEERPVYLFSPLSQDETEDLGMGYIDSPDRVKKMVERYKNAICLSEAQRWTVNLDEPEF